MSTLKTGEHSKGRKQSSQKEITSNCVLKGYNGGALYRPQKVKGRPSDMTLDKTTQILETITLTSCLCQGIGLTQQNKLLFLPRDTLEIRGTVEFDTKYF